MIVIVFVFVFLFVFVLVVVVVVAEYGGRVCYIGLCWFGVVHGTEYLLWDEAWTDLVDPSQQMGLLSFRTVSAVVVGVKFWSSARTFVCPPPFAEIRVVLSPTSPLSSREYWTHLPGFIRTVCLFITVVVSPLLPTSRFTTFPLLSASDMDFAGLINDWLEEGYFETALTLIAAEGFDPNEAALSGKLPLIEAAEAESEEVVRELLRLGADPNKLDVEEWYPLHSACVYGSTNIAAALLEYGANPHMREGRFMSTPIFCASRNGHCQIIRMLLDRNVDVEIPDVDQRTPLMYAAEKGHKDVMDILLAHNAKVNVVDKDGSTALMLAVKKSKLGCVQRLLANGADLFKVDNKGKTALNYATRNGPARLLFTMLESHAGFFNHYSDVPLVVVKGGKQGVTNKTDASS